MGASQKIKLENLKECQKITNAEIKEHRKVKKFINGITNETIQKLLKNQKEIIDRMKKLNAIDCEIDKSKFINEVNKQQKIITENLADLSDVKWEVEKAERILEVGYDALTLVKERIA